MFWQTSRFRIDLRTVRVMGIVNITPDSFSDGGQHATTAAALRHCERLIDEGADILDIGGESSRPGSEPVLLRDELARVVPVLKAAVGLGVPLSIDTCKPGVMRAALELGVDIVNDIAALVHPGALDAVASHPQCGVCLMHMRGEPKTMQADVPVYEDVVREVVAFLRQRAHAVRHAGIAAERITIDPGIGFGKTSGHNLALLSRQRELLALGYPLMVGWSRKRTLGEVTGRPVGDRAAASVAAALAAVTHGARVLRVHDVAATVDALKVWDAAGLGDVANIALQHNSDPELSAGNNQ